MHTNAISFAALAIAGLASAQNEPINIVNEAPSFSDPFGIEATAPNLSNGVAAVQLTASNGRIYIGGTQVQPTNCSSPQTRHDFATFVWYSDKRMYLYSNDPSKPQRVWSDVGNDGLVGYSTAKQADPLGQSLDPFEIDPTTGRVMFNCVAPKACPEGEDKPDTYGVWFTKAEKPGNLTGCFDVQLKAYKAPARDACTYSHLASCKEEPQSCGSKSSPIGR